MSSKSPRLTAKQVIKQLKDHGFIDNVEFHSSTQPTTNYSPVPLPSKSSSVKFACFINALRVPIFGSLFPCTGIDNVVSNPVFSKI